MRILMFVSALRSSINRCYWSAKCYSCMFILIHEIVNFNPKSLDYVYEVHNVCVPQGHLRVGGANIFQKVQQTQCIPLLLFLYIFATWFFLIIAILCLVYVVLKCSILYQLIIVPYQSHGNQHYFVFGFIYTIFCIQC